MFCNFISKTGNRHFCNNISKLNWHISVGKSASAAGQTIDVFTKKLGRLFAACAFGAKVIKTNPAHRPVKAQFMANRWMRSLGAIHAFTNRTANTNLVKPCRFGNINLIIIMHHCLYAILVTVKSDFTTSMSALAHFKFRTRD